ncbi:rRNA biogenesis protein rrp36 [Acrasis kona]|uniref:rRNA biogenesis protein rrp36 n=1 Tax=Acrasis kona TaxID=1008807 RepID=A0AAW2ZBW7_9EUKA
MQSGSTSTVPMGIDSTDSCAVDGIQITLTSINASIEKPFGLYLNSIEVLNLTTTEDSTYTVRTDKLNLESQGHTAFHCVYNQEEYMKMVQLQKGSHFNIFLDKDRKLCLKQSRGPQLINTNEDDEDPLIKLPQSYKEEIHNLGNCLKKRFITQQDFLDDVQKLLQQAEQESNEQIEQVTEEQAADIAILYKYVEKNLMTESEFKQIRRELLSLYHQAEQGKIAQAVFSKRKQRILGDQIDLDDVNKNLSKVQIRDARMAKLGLNKSNSMQDVSRGYQSPSPSSPESGYSTPTKITMTKRGIDGSPATPVSRDVLFDESQLTADEQKDLDQLSELYKYGMFSSEDFEKKKKILFEKSRSSRSTHTSPVVSPVHTQMVTKARPLAPAMAMNTFNGNVTGVVPLNVVNERNKGVFKGHFLAFENNRGSRSTPCSPSHGSPSYTKSQPSKQMCPSDEDVETLKQLTVLKDAGVLTLEEYNAKRRKILGL